MAKVIVIDLWVGRLFSYDDREVPVVDYFYKYLLKQ